MVVPPSTRAKAPKRRRSLTALKQTPLANPVSRPQGMTGVEETPQDPTAPTATGKPGLDQSGAGQKASSAHRGTKRRLAMPVWQLGDSFFRDAAFESYTRPPPQV